MIKLLTGSIARWIFGGLIIAGIAWSYWYIYSSGREAGINKTEARYESMLKFLEKERSRLERKYRKQEREYRARIDEIRDNHNAALEAERDELESTISDLRNDVISVRERFRCPAAGRVSEAAENPGRSDEETPGGLSRDDVEFLLRVASEADEITRQLQACQDTLRSFY